MTGAAAPPRPALFGASAMVAASVLRAVVQIAVLPIIGRLLGPQVYGLIALVSPFIFLAMLLAESGLGACLVRAPEVTPELSGTIFTFSATFSLVVIALFAALAMPIGWLLHAPAFPPLLLGMSSILLLAALNIVPASLLLRARRYDWMALSDVVSAVCGLAGVGLGIWLGWGAWSLVAQQIALWLAKVIVVTIGARWRPHFGFHWAVFKENIGFGANLTGASVLSFIARNIDNVLIGSLLGTEVLGFYALGFQIVGLPSMVLSSSIYFTVFAGTSEATRANRPAAGPFLQALKGSLLLSLPIMLGLAVTAPVSIPLILGAQWAPAVAVTMLLTPYGICQAIWPTLSGVLNGRGQAGAVLRLGLLSSVATIVAIIVCVPFGSLAVATGVSLTSVPGIVLAFRRVAKDLTIDGGRILRLFIAPVSAAIVMSIAVLLLQPVLLGRVSPVLCLLLDIGAGMAVYAGVLFGVFHEHIAEDVAAIKAMLRARRRSRGPATQPDS